MIFEYPGYFGCDSKCFVNINKQKDGCLVIITELKDNPGTSVTNTIETIATLVYDKYLKDYDIKKITWIEHYQNNREESLDIVTFDYNGIIFSNPKWKRLYPVNNTDAILADYKGIMRGGNFYG